jgi:hypothetical protein
MSLIEFCGRIGREIDSSFRRCHYNAETFPDIALSALAKYKPAELFSSADVVDAALSPELTWQANVESEFGEPALTLFADPRFRIEALCWRNSTTSVHQHQFEGAFTVLVGSSLQNTYKFSLTKRITRTFQLGTLEHLECKMLLRGHIEPILAGDDLIHSVFHLEVPSITLVVRTHSSIGLQLRYEWPTLAYYPRERDYQSTKCLEIVDYLCDVRPTGYLAKLMAIVSTSPLPLSFEVLRRTRLARLDFGEWQILMRAAASVHGSDLMRLTPVLDRCVDKQQLTNLRQRIKREDLRYLLALLLNVPDRKKIVATVAARVGRDQAAATIVRWIEEICELSGTHFPQWHFDRELLQSSLSNDPVSTSLSVEQWHEVHERLARFYLTAPLVGEAETFGEVIAEGSYGRH